MPRSLITSIVSVVALTALTAAAHAAQPSERLLPTTTKALVVVPDFDEFRAKWNETQLGQLAKDPVIKPFAEDLRRQIKFKLSQTGIRLGLTLEDLQGVNGGEICLAVIQPEGDKTQHALAIVADISGHNQQSKALLEKISANMIARGATKAVRQMNGVDVTVYSVPRKKAEMKTLHIYQFVVNDQLIAVDHEGEARNFIDRLSGVEAPVLADAPEYKVAMSRCDAEAGNVAPHFRWFIEPFGYAETIRAAAPNQKRSGTDVLAVLRNQGFTAVRSLAGQVTFSTGEHEMLYRAFIYAPNISSAENPNATGFHAAARMLDFPVGGNLHPQSWIPRNLATYLSFNWKIQEAFEHAKGLVDELAGEEVFEEVLEGIKLDPKGPQVDIRKELIAHLGQRATVVADHKVPVTPQSQRIMIAVELTNPEAVARTLDKAMETDPNAEKREFQGKTIWEMVEEETIEGLTLNIDGPPGLGPFGDDPIEEEEKNRPILPNSAITVAHGHLIFATHIDFIRELLTDVKDRQSLSESADYRAVSDALEKLGAGDDAFRFFGRADEAYRPTYELLRQGKMPQAETLLGRLLNALMAPEDEDQPRDQQIDGSKMPDFQVVRRYLGPIGAYVKTEGNGWYAAGCLLSKEVE